MSLTWKQTVTMLADAVPGWADVWSVVFAARGALAELAASPGADDDLALTYAGLDLTYALTEIEHVDPFDLGVAVSLAPVSGGDCPGAVAQSLDDLLVAVGRLVRDLAGAPDRSAEVVLAAARVRGLLAAARAHVAGGVR